MYASTFKMQRNDKNASEYKSSTVLVDTHLIELDIFTCCYT